MMPKRAVRTEQSAILEAAKDGALLDTAPAVDAHPKEVNAVTNSSKSSPTASPEPTALPAFQPITPDRVDAMYQELFKAYGSENAATKWSVRRSAIDLLEREQERVTRIYEAFYRGMDRRVTDPARTGEEGCA